VRSNRAIIEAGRGRSDTPAALALPRDLGEWKDTVEFVLGPYGTGKALAEVSAVDFARAPERVADAFCREGYGTLLARVAASLPVQLSQPVRRISWGGALSAETAGNTFRARALIITASTGVLASDAIAFDPPLVGSYRDAINALSLGQLEQIALEIPGNPFALDKDELIYEKSSGLRTAAFLANIGGTDLCTVSVGGKFGRELAQESAGAMTAFALDWLKVMFGADAAGKVKRMNATRWGIDPFTRGAFSAAAPGRAEARRTLMTPLRDRVWFAGEASHDTLWGTVNGAWESGTRAADAALRLIGNVKDDKREAEPKRQRRRRRD
jgi:monoamine oxidase